MAVLNESGTLALRVRRAAPSSRTLTLCACAFPRAWRVVDSEEPGAAVAAPGFDADQPEERAAVLAHLLWSSKYTRRDDAHESG